jgi:hypothetical protein
MRHRIALALVLMGLPLAAQDFTGGLQAGFSLPVGDLKDKSGAGTNQTLGIHFGGHLDFAVAPHQEVRAQITYHSLQGSSWGGFYDPQNDFKILQVGADWIYHFQGSAQGWYSIAGVSLNNIKDDYSGSGFSGSASQSGKLGVRGGAGYTFTKQFSLEGSLNQILVDKNGNDGFGFDTATWLQVSAVFRFGR